MWQWFAAARIDHLHPQQLKHGLACWGHLHTVRQVARAPDLEGGVVAWGVDLLKVLQPMGWAVHMQGYDMHSGGRAMILWPKQAL